MTVKDDLHQLVNELDGDAAREALAYLQSLTVPRVRQGEAPTDPVDDLELAELPTQPGLQIQEPEA
jgi:hypothetical protein